MTSSQTINCCIYQHFQLELIHFSVCIINGFHWTCFIRMNTCDGDMLSRSIFTLYIKWNRTNRPPLRFQVPARHKDQNSISKLPPNEAHSYDCCAISRIYCSLKSRTIHKRCQKLVNKCIIMINSKFTRISNAIFTCLSTSTCCTRAAFLPAVSQ